MSNQPDLSKVTHGNILHLTDDHSYDTPNPIKFGLQALNWTLRKIDETWDSHPLAPHNIAGNALEDVYKKRRKNVQSNPQWVEIEDRRYQGASGSIVFLSEEAGLGLMEDAVQRRIELETTPDPLWAPIARYIRARPGKALILEAKAAWQRTLHGWSDQDIWSLDTHLTKTLSDQLDELAATTHGWPQGDTYPTFDDWVSALHLNAAKLRAWGNHWDTEDPYETEPTSEEEYRKRGEAYLGEQEHRLLEAKEALRWVADNLDTLWD